MHVGGCLDLDDRRMCIAHELIALHIAIDGHTVPENEKPLATSNEYIRYVCTNGIHTTNSEEKRKARCVCRTGVLCCAVCVRTTANGQYLHWMVHWPRSPPSISLCHHWTMSAPIRWMLWCSLAAVCGSSGFLWRCACIWHTDESRQSVSLQSPGYGTGNTCTSTYSQQAQRCRDRVGPHRDEDDAPRIQTAPDEEHSRECVAPMWASQRDFLLLLLLTFGRAKWQNASWFSAAYSNNCRIESHTKFDGSGCAEH